MNPSRRRPTSSRDFGERFESERSDELRRAARHYHMHVMAALGEAAGKVGGLVGGNEPPTPSTMVWAEPVMGRCGEGAG